MSDPQPSPPLPPNGSQEQPVPPETDSTIKPDPDLDASIEQDIDMTAEQTAAGENPDEGAGAIDPIAAAPTPSKKETSLREFLGKMDDYAPIVSGPLPRL